MQHHLPPIQEYPGQEYFDVDGDKELYESRSAETHEMAFTWRGDPEETFSDWTINVVTNELRTFTFHVHKSVMCFGRRQSKYFARIMLNHTPTKTKNKKYPMAPSTKVELDQRDAENFHILLDFMYASCTNISSTGTVVTAASTITTPTLGTAGTLDDDATSHSVCDDISTRNAVSLRFLARFFEVDAFMLVVNKFIQKDLSFKTGPHYLSEAASYKDERLEESARRLCTENIEQIDKKALMKVPIQVFRKLIKSLESFEDENEKLSLFLSEVVCRYFEKHPKILSGELLLELTDTLVMPCITSEAAIGFTALIKELSNDDATQHWDGLVRLSRRCAKAVVHEYGWTDFSVNAAVDEYLGRGKRASREVSKVDSLLFATSFAAALEQAQDDYEEVTLEQERLELMVGTLDRSVTVLEKGLAKKDEYLAKQQAAIDEAKRQIRKLKQQIGDIKKDQLRRQVLQSQQASQSNLDHSVHSSSQDPAIQDLVGIDATRDLISPSQITADIHEKKNKRKQELRTRHEMRSISLM